MFLACHFDLDASNQNQSLSSPNFPENYPNNTNCTWTITAPPGQFVFINFEIFSTEECCDDLNVSVIVS